MGFFWGGDPAFDTLSDNDLVAVVRRLDPRGQHAIAAYRMACDGRGDPTDNRSIAVAIASDLTFRNAAIKLAEYQSAQATAHMYRFDWACPLYDDLIGSCHVLELPFVFGTYRHPANRAFVGDAMQNAWVAFAHTGDPGWPAYETHDRSTQIFDRVTSIELDPAAAERCFWSVGD